MRIEPLQLIGNEMKYLKNNIRQLLGTGHPMLDTVAKYYNQAEGKHFRPMVVLLMSRATSLSPKRPRDASSAPSGPAWSIDRSISPLSVLSDFNPLRPTSPMEDPSPAGSSDILPSQRRLAEIIELIHTASLLHDDIIDQSGMRRSMPSANVAFGNKMAVLAGDFLLGRASAALARLRHAEVTELIATVVANLVEGEFMQLKNTVLDGVPRGEGDVTEPASHAPVSTSQWAEDALEFYLQKTYLKSASLISKSCRASALLGQCTPDVVDAAYAYGKNLGMAFQLVDDMLDYTVTADELGKPAGADLELGLVTAPLLFAWKEHDELGSLVQRRFQGEGDVERVSIPSSFFPLPLFFFPDARYDPMTAKTGTRWCRPGRSCSRAVARNRHARWRRNTLTRPWTPSENSPTETPKRASSIYASRRWIAGSSGLRCVQTTSARQNDRQEKYRVPRRARTCRKHRR